MKWLITAAIIITAAGSYLLYYPPVVLKGRTQAALDKFAASVQLKDRDSISEALHQLLTEDAKIILEVSFFSIGAAGANPVVTQDFDKAEFILFIDNVLYPLTDYGYSATLDNFLLDAEHKNADITFSSEQWAEGSSLMGGISLRLRYDSSAHCDGHVIFNNQSPRLEKVRCKVTLRPSAS